ncbi:nucleoside-diphosphate-sugar epimerase [Catenulispora sp. GAS73]|uniref:NAD-dependent epimerase/dehydratase family protein n=1 Tax=Catenulispora sp. GAS73 TaxID=3156269 RepID=UPI003517BC86
MRIFVTGASGYIGSAVVPELLQAGHQVVGLARSDASADAVAATGAEVRRGDMTDLDLLAAAAAEADAVVHLAFDHATVFAGRFPDAAATDLSVIRAFGDALVGTGKILVGIGIRRTGDAQRDAAFAANPRSIVTAAMEEYTERGVHTVFMAIPSATHSSRDKHGFIPQMIRIARERGVSGYVGDGANRWPAGHVLDVARLYRLALDKAPAGEQLFAAAEEGVAVRDVAEAIGRHLDVPVVSVPAEKAAEHFAGFPFAAMDITMPNAATRELLGWEPQELGLIADIDAGHYFVAGE